MSGAVEGVALLPCPFCGWDAKVSTTLDQPESHFVLCQRCETMGAYFATSSEAITAWNTRTTPPARSYADGVQLAFRAGHRAARIRYAPAEPNGPTRFENVDWEDAAIRLLSQGEKA